MVSASELTTAAPVATEVARAAQSEASQTLNQIMAVILNPDVPDARLSILLKMHTELVADQRRMLFVEAKARMMSILPTIDKSGKIVVYSRADRDYAAKNNGEYPPTARPIQQTPYAKQEDLIEAVRPIIGEYGFDLSFVPGKNAEGRITMKGRLSHVGGHVEEIDVPSIEVDTTGNKNNAQGLGSSLKYLQRYGTLLLLPGIVSRDPHDGLDNDGANGAPTGRIDSEQFKALRDEILRREDRALGALLKFYEIEALADLPAVKFEEAMAKLKGLKPAAAR